MRRMSSSVCIILLVICSAASAQGPLSPLYVTGVKVVNGIHEYWIEVLQGSSVINGWQQYGMGNIPSYPPPPYSLPLPVLESAIAVTSTIKTVGGSICSGACAPFPVYQAGYSITGGFLGASAITVPDSGPGQHDYLYDGTTDGTHTYAIGTLSGNVYTFDSNWQNAVPLFVLPTLGTSSLWYGIAYDPAGNSLWVLDINNSTVRNYSLAGTLLSSFILTVPAGAANGAGGLALDPADQTIWTSFGGYGRGPFFLAQYSKGGTLLSSQTYSAMSSFDLTGMEFAMATLTSDQAIANLITMINNFGLPQGTAPSLNSKLNEALADIRNKNKALACENLSALMNEAKAQSGKHLTVAQADAIISAAQQIRTLLGC